MTSKAERGKRIRERRARLRELLRRQAARFGDHCSYSPDGAIFGAGSQARYVTWWNCCKIHDAAYALRLGGYEGRRRADQELARCMGCTIREAGFRIWAKIYSGIYYRSVRIFGRLFWDA